MRRFRSALVVMGVLGASLVAPTTAASADVETPTSVTLPQAGDGQMLVDRQHDALLISGGADDPVMRVDLATREVEPIPDSSGMVSLDLSADGSAVYGASPATRTLVEINLETLAVRRWSPDVTEGCFAPTATMRGGQIFFGLSTTDSTGCTQSYGLWRLDMATGESQVVLAPGGFREARAAGNLLGVPGDPSHLVDLGFDPDNTSCRLAVGDDGTTTAGPCGYVYTRGFGDSHFTDDGTLIATNSDLNGPPFGAYVDPDTMAFADGAGNGTLAQTTADTEVVLPQNPDLGAVVLQRRVDHTRIATLRPAGDRYRVIDARLVGDTLYTVARSDGQRRLVITPNATAPVADLTLSVDPSTWVGHDTEARGHLVDASGVALGAMRVDLREISPVSRDLASTTTASDGTWNTTFLPDSPPPEPSGWVAETMIVEARASAGGNDLVSRQSISVLRHGLPISVLDPPDVSAGEYFWIRGYLEDVGSASGAGQDIQLSRTCLSPAGQTEAEGVTRAGASQGDISAFVPAGTGCHVYRLDLDATVGGTDYHQELLGFVDRPRTSVDVSGPASTTPGQAAQVRVVLSDQDGQPVPDAPLLLWVTPPGQDEVGVPLTTDSAGVATYDLPPSSGGTWELRATYDGSWEHRPVESSAPTFVTVARRATTISASMPPQASRGDTVTLSGTLSDAPPTSRVVVYGPDGTAYPTVTDSGGGFSRDVLIDAYGPQVWRACFFGDMTRAAVCGYAHVDVAKIPTQFVDVLPTSFRALDGSVEFTGRLQGVSGPVDIEAHWQGRPTVYADVTTDAQGNFTFPMDAGVHAGPATIDLSYGGDHDHAPASYAHVVTIGKAQPALTVTGPGSVTPDADLVVSLEASNWCPAGCYVTVTDPAGATRSVLLTPGQNVVHLTVPRDASGDTVWTFQLAGDDDLLPVIATYETWAPTTPVLTLALNAETYVAGDLARVHLGISGSSSRDVTLTATTALGDVVTLFHGVVPEAGLDVPWRVWDNATLSANVAATARENAASAVQGVGVRLDDRISPTRTTGLVGGDALYGPRAIPTFRLRVRPSRPGECQRFHTQVRTRRGWADQAVTGRCLSPTDAGLVEWKDHYPVRAGSEYRVRAEFGGGVDHLSSRSTWQRFRRVR